jgi:hypothetical protein
MNARNSGYRWKGLTLAALASMGLALFGTVRFAAAADAAFNGEITDANLNCVQTPMKAPEGLKAKDACVLYWAHSAQPNEKFVLYDAATKTTYQLDDQDMVEPYVGEKVQVTGTLNAGTKTIKVTGIKVP